MTGQRFDRALVDSEPRTMEKGMRTETRDKAHWIDDSELGREWLKVYQDLPYVPEYIPESDSNQLSASWPAWRERYIQDALDIPLEFRVWARGWSEVTKYRAVLNRNGIQGQDFQGRAGDIFNPGHGGAVIQDRIGDVQRPMLVFIREVSQQPERVKFRPVHSVIWLQRLDSQLSTRVNPVHLFASPTPKSIRITEDRKLRSPVRLAPVSEHQLPREMIQSGTEIMEAIADHSRQDFGGPGTTADFCDEIIRLWVGIESNAIRVRVPKVLHQHYDFFQVVVRPF